MAVLAWHISQHKLNIGNVDLEAGREQTGLCIILSWFVLKPVRPILMLGMATAIVVVPMFILDFEAMEERGEGHCSGLGVGSSLHVET